jgi:peptidyl-prolyl cis-trans isomerase C
MKFIKSLVLLFIVISFYCKDSSKKETITVAKVGRAELLMSDLKEFLPKSPGLNISSVQIEQYIKRWIENELVYQEALKHNLHSEPEIRRQLERLQKQFIVSTFLEQIIDKNITVSEEELLDFYQEKSSEYIREHDQYLVDLLLVGAYNKANQLRKKILNGLEFEKAAKENSLDSSKEKGGHLGWVVLDELSDRLAKTIPSLALKSLSKPINTEIGWALIIVQEKRNKGEVKTLEEVYDLLTWRLRARKREISYRRLISKLSENTDIEQDLSRIYTVLGDSVYTLK